MTSQIGLFNKQQAGEDAMSAFFLLFVLPEVPLGSNIVPASDFLPA